MRNYPRTLIIVATAIGLLLVMLLAGCNNGASSVIGANRAGCGNVASQPGESGNPDYVGGGSIDNATGRVTVGGCVVTKAVKQ